MTTKSKLEGRWTRGRQENRPTAWSNDNADNQKQMLRWTYSQGCRHTLTVETPDRQDLEEKTFCHCQCRVQERFGSIFLSETLACVRAESWEFILFPLACQVTSWSWWLKSVHPEQTVVKNSFFFVNEKQNWEAAEKQNVLWFFFSFFPSSTCFMDHSQLNGSVCEKKKCDSHVFKHQRRWHKTYCSVTFSDFYKSDVCLQDVAEIRLLGKKTIYENKASEAERGAY